MIELTKGLFVDVVSVIDTLLFKVFHVISYINTYQLC